MPDLRNKRRPVRRAPKVPRKGVVPVKKVNKNVRRRKQQPEEPPSLRFLPERLRSFWFGIGPMKRHVIFLVTCLALFWCSLYLVTKWVYASEDKGRGHTTSQPAVSGNGPAGRDQPSRPGGTIGSSTSSPAERPPDKAQDLLRQLAEGDYTYRVDIATGRFLRDFDQHWLDLRDIDRSRVRAVRRGANWARVEAPYDPSQPGKPKGVGQLRLVQQDGVWKVEHVKVILER